MSGFEDIREHMEVIGADGVHLGTVDRIEGNRIKLIRADSGIGPRGASSLHPARPRRRGRGRQGAPDRPRRRRCRPVRAGTERRADRRVDRRGLIPQRPFAPMAAEGRNMRKSIILLGAAAGPRRLRSVGRGRPSEQRGQRCRHREAQAGLLLLQGRRDQGLDGQAGQGRQCRRQRQGLSFRPALQGAAAARYGERSDRRSRADDHRQRHRLRRAGQLVGCDRDDPQQPGRHCREREMRQRHGRQPYGATQEISAGPRRRLLRTIEIARTLRA